MTNRQFVETALNIANNYSTIYAIGTIGNPVTATLISQKAKQYPNWYTATIQSKLKLVVGKNYFAFDCVGMIKSVLWGWTGDNTKSNGGAVYQSNGVPDMETGLRLNVRRSGKTKYRLQRATATKQDIIAVIGRSTESHLISNM